MTVDGNHGGGSELELRTVLFAYQKQKFPMSTIFEQNQEEFYYLDGSLKLADLPSIVSTILDLPFPFSNLGVFHPIFANSHSLYKTHEKFVQNIVQINTYLKHYCSETSQFWCDQEMTSFDEQLNEFKQFKASKLSDSAIINHIDDMSKFANEKFIKYQTIWVKFDELSLIFAIITGFCIVII